MSIEVLLADDHRIMRKGLRLLLEKQADIKVIGEANDGRKAVKMAKSLSPDVVIMDITMPDLNGVEATRKVLEECPGTKVVGLSVHPDKQFVMGMLEAGASGYLLKDCDIEDVVRAIQAAVEGQTYLCPQVAGIVVDGCLRRNRPRKGVHASTLSPREREILQLLAEGKRRGEIGDLLRLSPRTIESHRRNIMEKLKTNSTAEMVKWAIREGLTPL